MKALRIVSLVLGLVLLVACGTNPAAEEHLSDAESQDVKEASMSTVNTADAKQASEDTHVADTLLEVYVIGGESPGMAYASELMQKAGFDIEFKSLGNMTEEKLTTELSNSDTSGNKVYVFNQNAAISLVDKGLLGNFYEVAALHAPEYLRNAPTVNPPGELYLMPANMLLIPARPAALIKNEVYSEYGKEIRSASEYIELLKWLKGRDGGSVPGVVQMQEFDRQVGRILGYSALNLMLPEKGYTSLSCMFIQGTGASNFLWMNKDTNKIDAFYNISAAQEAIAELYGLKRDGLLYFAAEGERVDHSQYPTILINTGQYKLKEGVETQYTMNIFAEPLTDYGEVDMVALAAPGTDVSEFLRFMEWMGDIDNFKHFMYGVEDVDYTEDERGYITDTKISEYYKWEYKGVFRRSKFMLDIYDFSENAPVGYEKEITALKHMEYPLDWQTRRDIGARLTEDKLYEKFVNEVDRIMQRLTMTLFLLDSPPEPLSTITDAFEEIRQLDYAQLATEQVEGAIAGIR